VHYVEYGWHIPIAVCLMWCNECVLWLYDRLGQYMRVYMCGISVG